MKKLMIFFIGFIILTEVNANDVGWPTCPCCTSPYCNQ